MSTQRIFFSIFVQETMVFFIVAFQKQKRRQAVVQQEKERSFLIFLFAKISKFTSVKKCFDAFFASSMLIIGNHTITSSTTPITFLNNIIW